MDDTVAGEGRGCVASMRHSGSRATTVYAESAIWVRQNAGEMLSSEPVGVTRMAARFDDIVATAMKLPEDERARLAQELLASLDGEIDADVEALWLAEAERRLEELRSGKVRGVPSDEAFAKARDALRR
jgi:putative addiction module component (TIGR02574 family)